MEPKPKPEDEDENDDINWDEYDQWADKAEAENDVPIRNRWEYPDDTTF